MPVYHVYWVSYLEAYRVYDPAYPGRTVVYVDDLSDLTDRGFDYILEDGV